MAVPYTFADTTLSGLNLNLANLDADFTYITDTIHPITVMPTVSVGGTTQTVFTGIPSWARKIIVNFGNITVSGTSNVIISFGTSGGFVTSGYYSVATDGTASLKSTSCFAVSAAMGVLGSLNGSITFNFASDIPPSSTTGFWLQSGAVTNSDSISKVTTGAGSAYFTSPVTQVKITTLNGTDTFAGIIGLTYE